MTEQRIGVWICDCAGQISDGIDVDRVEAAAHGLGDVCRVHRVEKLCGLHDQDRLRKGLEADGVERLLFAGCSPRSSLKFPEQQLTRAMVGAGLDRAFLEVANLREQCAWMHESQDEATRKAIDLLRMAHARLRGAESSPESVAIAPEALVIGGGSAGLQAAKSLASAGQKVTLVERSSYLGGRLCQIGFLFQCESWPSYCRSECVGPVQAMNAVLHPGIHVHVQSSVESIEKVDGNFQASLTIGAKFVDSDACVSCGECASVCPEETVAQLEQGVFRRRAIDKDFERAVPDAYSIIDEACTRCGDCVEVCPTGAINLEAKPDRLEQEFGAVFLATGFEHHDLKENPELGSESPRVVSGLEFEGLLDSGLVLNKEDEPPERIVFVLCAGSRAALGSGRKGMPYCSKTCCATTVKQAERVASRHPETEVVVVYYNDIRTYERALEDFYQKLHHLGVEFVNGEVETIVPHEDGRLRVTLELGPGDEVDLEDAEGDDETLVMESDLVVLAAAQRPRKSGSALLEQLGVLTDPHGYPLEGQIRLFRPTESMVDRVYAVGAAVGPKIVQQAVEQGSAGAMKALPMLMNRSKPLDKYISTIARERCTRCKTCISVCPHGAITMTPDGAVSDPAFCQACGFCAAACPTHAAQLRNCSDEQILEQVAVAFDELPAGQPKILALLCYWCAYGGEDMAGIKRLEVPSNHRTIAIRCSSSVNLGLVMEMFRLGVDGVLIAGCPEKNCHHAWGNYLADRRVTLMRKLMKEMGLDDRRLRFEYIGVPQSQKLVTTLSQMNQALGHLGPNPIPVRERN